MHKFLIFFLVGFCSFGQANAQTPKDSIRVMGYVKAMLHLDKKYDQHKTKAARRKAFDSVVANMPDGDKATEDDKAKAFKIVDAYISASKGKKVAVKVSDKDKKDIEKILTDANQKKTTGMQAMQGEAERIKSMSYSEYKAFVSQNGQIPFKESDIQKAFNDLHKDDGKQVAITPDAPQPMNYIQAIDILNNPKEHTYQEFKTAVLYLKPNLTEPEIQKMWHKSKK